MPFKILPSGGNQSRDWPLVAPPPDLRYPRRMHLILLAFGLAWTGGSFGSVMSLREKFLNSETPCAKAISLPPHLRPYFPRKLEETPLSLGMIFPTNADATGWEQWHGVLESGGDRLRLVEMFDSKAQTYPDSFAHSGWGYGKPGLPQPLVNTAFAYVRYLLSERYSREQVTNLFLQEDPPEHVVQLYEFDPLLSCPGAVRPHSFVRLIDRGEVFHLGRLCNLDGKEGSADRLLPAVNLYLFFRYHRLPAEEFARILKYSVEILAFDEVAVRRYRRIGFREIGIEHLPHWGPVHKMDIFLEQLFLRYAQAR